ncbi:MAG TPA: protein kinase, partial [Chitinophagaceae bacterium]|nr:protein kinase [Chitinophagaceae bacterium]
MIGKNIQNYTVTSYLGEGGMGTVYKASDTMLGRDVALKMLHGTLVSQPQFLERFKKEARVLAQLLHPNIAVIYNFIGQDDHHFMVMEYV